MVNSFVLFMLHRGFYGVDLHNVVSIEKVIDTSSYPNMPEYMLGIVTIRGKIIPVVDVSKLLYNESTQIDESTRYILVETNGVTIALMVEKTNEIIDIEENQLNPVNFLGQDEGTYIKGVALQENRIITIIEISELVSSMHGIDLIKDHTAELTLQN
ncbi:chemotaxis protein CheW [Bacillus sp. T33-2]|uniref:chemotaxis protein CheW n=1 Tax=Bacillus sp. T33-2 TaxID=2054168 RepID=UPI000C792A6D|nr:chemotaxis protein CheW [Bacillus sp. T33-2]PLR96753.1 hypothetical protein CVD19_10260 [Bacillus sp. T33-2]